MINPLATVTRVLPRPQYTPQRPRPAQRTARLQAHRTAVSIRPEFDKYHSDEPGAQDDFYGTPLSIA